jgi:hypothetical protein
MTTCAVSNGAILRRAARPACLPGMAVLRHEVWIDRNGLPGCCLAGADGDGARKLFAEEDARIPSPPVHSASGASTR